MGVLMFAHTRMPDVFDPNDEGLLIIAEGDDEDEDDADEPDDPDEWRDYEEEED